MRRFLAPALILLLFAVSLRADFVIPQQKIVGAENPVPLGELVDLALSPITTRPEHFVANSFNWKVVDLSNGQEKRVREADGGIFFGAGIEPKRLKAFCAVTYLYVVKTPEGLTKEIATRTVILTADVIVGKDPGPGPGPGPNPPPPPGPSPEPDPVFPDGRFGLSRFAYETAMSKVSADKRQTAALTLANSFRAIASAIVAGTIKSDREVLQKTKDSNNEALRRVIGDTQPWEAFSTQLEDKLYGLYQTGKLKSLSDYAEAWREIAYGLDKVK